MTDSAYFTKRFVLGLLLVLVCSTSSTFGCGSSDDEAGPELDSALPGVYKVDSYQSNPEGCEPLMDEDPVSNYLVVYGFRPNDDPDQARLGAVFCQDVDRCRSAALEAAEPLIGYSFSEGDDASGWQGWGIASAGSANDQCRASLQRHVLTSGTAEAIRIETTIVETVFTPSYEGNTATCSYADAVASVSDELPCEARILVQGTLEAAL